MGEDGLLMKLPVNSEFRNRKRERNKMTQAQSIPIGDPFNLTDFIPYAIGSVVSKTLLKRDIGTITLFSFDTGQGLSEHTAPFDAVVQILDGQAEITIGGKTRMVRSGEMLIMPANVPHALQAKEKFKMLLTMIRSSQ
jgi:quercetin dioxygenase-like cupin family protein